MKKDGIVNQDLLNVMGSLGHTDRIVVCDEGLPIDKTVKRINLCARRIQISFYNRE